MSTKKSSKPAAKKSAAKKTKTTKATARSAKAIKATSSAKAAKSTKSAKSCVDKCAKPNKAGGFAVTIILGVTGLVLISLLVVWVCLGMSA